MSALSASSSFPPDRPRRAAEYARSALLIAGALMLFTSVGRGVPPVAVAALFLAAGAAWTGLSLSISRTVPRMLVKTAGGMLLLSALIVGVRVTTTHAWLPTSNGSVLDFLAAELFLVPVAVLLLALALIWRLFARRKVSSGPEDRSDRAHVTGATALVVLAALLLIGSQVSPRIFGALSGRLEWGRYGFSPPVRLTTLRTVTRATGMRFPNAAALLGGEFINGGFAPFIMARVRLPQQDVEIFLKRQRPPFSWGRIERGKDALEELAAMANLGSMRWMKGRGWRPDLARRVIVAQGDAGPGRAGELWAVIDLDAPDHAVLYIFWAPN